MAKYESTGTWFDPRRQAIRDIDDALTKQMLGRTLRWAIYPGFWAQVSISPDQKITLLRTWEKPKTMTDEKKTEVRVTCFVPSVSLMPSQVQITTPAGHATDADAAAKAYDKYAAYNSAGWKSAYENANLADTHCRERDEAIKQRNAHNHYRIAALVQRDEARKEVEALKHSLQVIESMNLQNVETGARYLDERDSARAERDSARAERDSARAERDSARAERDSARAERGIACQQARADLAKLRAESGGRRDWQHVGCGTIDALRAALDGAARDALPFGIDHQVVTEEVSGVRLGTVQVVIRTRGQDTPVTVDTPVTLGMLRELTDTSDTIARGRGARTTTFDGRYSESAIGLAIDRKLGR